MATVHKKYGGSAIERTMLCPGSVKAIMSLPERATNEAAARGTRIHEWFERYLKNDYSVKAKTEQDQKEATIAARAGEKAKELIAQFGMTLSDFRHEELMAFHPDYPDAGGSADLFGYQNFRDLVVIDLKAGHREVQALDNHQLAFYACMVLNNIDPFSRATLDNCHMVILQPNEDGSDVQARVWSRPIADLPAYEALYKAAIIRAESEPDHRIPGAHCVEKYCDFRATCPEYLSLLASTSNEESAKIFQQVANAPDRAARLKLILDNAKEIEDLIDQAKKDAKVELQVNPDAIPGWFLKTDVKGDRAFSDPKKAEKVLKGAGLKLDDIAPRKLLSVAQMEKLCKDKNVSFELLSDFITRPDGTPQLKKGQRPEVFAALEPPANADPKVLAATAGA